MGQKTGQLSRDLLELRWKSGTWQSKSGDTGELQTCHLSLYSENSSGQTSVDLNDELLADSELGWYLLLQLNVSKCHQGTLLTYINILLADDTKLKYFVDSVEGRVTLQRDPESLEGSTTAEILKD